MKTRLHTHYAAEQVGGRAPAQGHKLNSPLVKFVELAIDGQPGIEDEFLGIFTGALFPERHEVQEGVPEECSSR